jgi:hypothetical protein
MLYIRIVFALACLLTGVRPMAAQGDCKVILDAESKGLNTPSHQYTVGNG